MTIIDDDLDEFDDELDEDDEDDASPFGMVQSYGGRPLPSPPAPRLEIRNGTAREFYPDSPRPAAPAAAPPPTTTRRQTVNRTALRREGIVLAADGENATGGFAVGDRVKILVDRPAVRKDQEAEIADGPPISEARRFYFVAVDGGEVWLPNDEIEAIGDAGKPDARRSAGVVDDPGISRETLEQAAKRVASYSSRTPQQPAPETLADPVAELHARRVAALSSRPVR